MNNALSLVQEWIDKSSGKVEVIPRLGRENGCEEVLGITENSTLGTIINHTGGISVANGTIRHFGGDNRYDLSVKSVNSIEDKRPRRIPGVLVAADDIYGGIFAINESVDGVPPGMMLYLPPESYSWETLDIGHSDFVQWSMSEHTGLFYLGFDKIPRQCVPGFAETLDFSPPLWVEDTSGTRYSVSVISSKKMHRIRIGLLEQL